MIAVSALFGLLLFATSAYAECAWVLWKQGAFLGSSGQMLLLDPTPIGGHSTNSECRDAGKSELAMLTGQGWLRKSVSTVAKTDGQFFHFTCLPDTVDPRGPKGTK